MKAIHIQWDVDEPDELEGLPTEIQIPDGMRTRMRSQTTYPM